MAVLLYTVGAYPHTYTEKLFMIFFPAFLPVSEGSSYRARFSRVGAYPHAQAAVDATSNVFVFTDTDGDRIRITRHVTSCRLTTVTNDANESCDWVSYDHGDGTYNDSEGHGIVPQKTRAALQAWLEVQLHPPIFSMIVVYMFCDFKFYVISYLM